MSNRWNLLGMARAKAFSVHLLTASGSLLALLALVAASEERWTAMFLWLGLALLVDGVDGPIARRMEVKRHLPGWSGDTLDNIIDYGTYALIPAFALYKADLVGEGLSFLCAALIVVTSAVYYADTGMKTAESFFKGFPVVWNMVVFTLFVVEPAAPVALAIVLLSAVMTFLPVQFLHPVRVKRLRAVNFGVFLGWCGFGLAALLQDLQAGMVVKAGIALTGAYLYLIGAVMQILPQLGKRRVGE